MSRSNVIGMTAPAMKGLSAIKSVASIRKGGSQWIIVVGMIEGLGHTIRIPRQGQNGCEIEHLYGNVSASSQILWLDIPDTDVLNDEEIEERVREGMHGFLSSMRASPSRITFGQPRSREDEARRESHDFSVPLTG